MYSTLITKAHISVQPNYLSIFNRTLNTDNGKPFNYKRHALTRNNDTKGKISKHASRRISKAFNWLVYLSKRKKVLNPATNKAFTFRLNFITLTLPAEQLHSDNVIKTQALNHFLQILRRDHGLKHYLWKAESQQNGNIHFHVITGIFLHYKLVQDIWNHVLSKLGYIDRFYEVHKHRNPHSTEVKAVKRLNQLSIYIVKYFLKNSSGRQIKGRLWYASASLLNLPSNSEPICNKIDAELRVLFRYYQPDVFHSAYSSTYFYTANDLKKCKCQVLLSMLNEVEQKINENIPP